MRNSNVDDLVNFLLLETKTMVFGRVSILCRADVNGTEIDAQQRNFNLPNTLTSVI